MNIRIECSRVQSLTDHSRRLQTGSWRHALLFPIHGLRFELTDVRWSCRHCMAAWDVQLRNSLASTCWRSLTTPDTLRGNLAKGYREYPLTEWLIVDGWRYTMHGSDAVQRFDSGYCHRLVPWLMCFRCGRFYWCCGMLLESDLLYHLVYSFVSEYYVPKIFVVAGVGRLFAICVSWWQFLVKSTNK